MLKEDNKPTLSSLKHDLSLTDDLGFDSLALAKLTVIIEDEFNIDIFEDGIVYTIGDIIKKLKV